MSELMLINPRKRRKARKMTAKQAKYFGKRRKRRASPARAKVARVAAPRRRRRRAAAKSVGRGRVVYARRRRSSRRRSKGGGGLSLRSLTNPSSLMRQIMPAALGAAGALAFDVAYALVPIPATWKAGPLAPITKVAFILGAGVVASMFAPKKLAGEAVAGALLVTAYDFLKTNIRTMAPTLPLSEYVSGVGYISPAMQIGPMGEYVSGVGEMPTAYNSSPLDMDEVF